MKRITFFIISVFFFAPAFSQFQLSHGTWGDESGQSIRKTPFDKGYIIAGYTDFKYMPGYNAILSKTSKDGHIYWSRIYGGDGTDYFNSVRPVYLKEFNGYVALGSTNSIGAGGTDMFMVRTDTIGRPVSVNTYGGSQYEGGACIQVVRNPRTRIPELVMIGHSSSYFPVIDKKLFVVKTALNGKYLDAIVFSDEGAHAGNWIEQTSDGGFIAVGTTTNSCCCGPNFDVENWDIFVVKLNYSLDVEWARTIGGDSSLYDNDVANSVKETKDGYIVTGYTESLSQNNFKDVFILKLNHKGGFMWMKNYGRKGDDIGNDILNVEDTVLGYQYLVNGKINIDGPDYALLMATDYYGNLKWSKAYGMKKDDEAGLEMDRNGEEGYAFTGSVKSFGEGKRDIYQVVTDNYGNSNCPLCEVKVKMDSSAQKPCIKDKFNYQHVKTGMRQRIKYDYIVFKQNACPQLLFSPKEKASSVYSLMPEKEKLLASPNPVSGFVQIKYPEKFQNGKLNIYNNTGQLILSKKLPDNKIIELSVESIKNGIYRISVFSKNGEYLTANLLVAH
jgi:hypothetical protein